MLFDGLSATIRNMAQAEPAAQGPNENLRRAVGRAVHDLRRERGWSLEDLGSRASLYPSPLSRIERGVVELDLEKLDRIAVVFGLKLSELLRMAEEAASAYGLMASSRSAKTHRGRSEHIQPPLMAQVR